MSSPPPRSQSAAAITMMSNGGSFSGAINAGREHSDTVSSGAKLFRLVMLGQGGTGKSNVADRFVRNIYTDPHKITLGVEFQTKHIALENGSRVKFEIWDTSGQERYNALAPMYYRGANAALVVYDITDKGSYERAKTWVGELRQKALADMVIVLVGNKIDLAAHRTVETLDAEIYAEDQFLSFAEVSAKTGVGIQELFENLAQRLLNELSLQIPMQPPLPTGGRQSAVTRSNSNPAVAGKLQPPTTNQQNGVIKLRNQNKHNGSNSKKGCSCGSVVVTVNDD